MIQIPHQDAARAACALLLACAASSLLFLLLSRAPSFSCCCWLRLLSSPSSLFVLWLSLPASLPLCVLVVWFVAPFVLASCFVEGWFIFDCLPQHHTHPPQCAIFLVQEKVTQGRASRRSTELIGGLLRSCWN